MKCTYVESVIKMAAAFVSKTVFWRERKEC
jgi:hypothetical protein